MAIIQEKRLYLAYLIGAVLVLTFGFLCFRILCHRGSGTDPTREQLRQIESHQQQVTKGIQSAEETNDGIGDAIDRGAERIEKSKGTIQSAKESIERTGDDLDEAGRIIEDCKRILRNVRERKQ